MTGPQEHTHLMLVAPSANRVYTAGAAPLAAAELELCGPFTDVRPVTLAGVDYLGFEVPELDADALRVLAGHSTHLATFERAGTAEDPLLRPVEVPSTDVLDDDLVTIPKYQGKTNELFTRLLLNVTLAQVRTRTEGPLTVLDPLCGRGTTLTTAWLAGHHAAGVEADVKALEQMAAFLKTWLRRKRLKHTADVSPVRRDGKSLGRRLDVEVRPADGPVLRLTAFSGDTRQSAELYGRRTFDAVVTDAPYGVVHGSRSDVRGVSGRRDRSAAALLREAVPVWAGQLKDGGALGISWNTLQMTREELAEVLTAAGLEPFDGGPWLQLAHRVDASIQRDLMVARKV
ncbi:TRM11 family SAM-dependent methyltransferase [Desertihabitans aurantiacus]|uniref:TRM11 family SAM-dependent methyltransferase n=1 Tax=Desertihabitans aurantiacus TaxID=2282477 RepID=UPI000DF7D530|nr:site-specific DNA-methyltransferase [Desertihabitans aurantiacus]